MSPQNFYLYLLTWTLVALTPGPAVIYSMSQASRHGFRASLAGIAGIQVGNMLFFGCIALGLGTLLETATTAFEVLRFVGAIYLIYLGIRAIAGSFRRSVPGDEKLESMPPAHGNLLLQGLLIQVTNPKALLFVSALLPQFIDPSRAMPVQLTILVLTTITVDAIVLAAYASLAQRGSRSFRSSKWGASIERAFGAAMVFFGLRLLLGRR